MKKQPYSRSCPIAVWGIWAVLFLAFPGPSQRGFDIGTCTSVPFLLSLYFSSVLTAHPCIFQGCQQTAKENYFLSYKKKCFW